MRFIQFVDRVNDMIPTPKNSKEGDEKVYLDMSSFRGRPSIVGILFIWSRMVLRYS